MTNENPDPLAERKRIIAGRNRAMALVLLGLATRPAAFVMSGEMAVAYFQEYAPKAFFPVINGGVGAALYCWIFFYLAFAGGGPWSLDALIARAGARRDAADTRAALPTSSRTSRCLVASWR